MSILASARKHADNSVLAATLEMPLQFNQMIVRDLKQAISLENCINI
jgi:hypothetical protein